jgi:hypothetical protein
MGLFTRNATPEQHVADEAARFVKTVAKSGHRDDAAALDFSPASVRALDAVLARHRGDVDADGVPDSVSLGAACYFFETIRREYGGRLCSGTGDIEGQRQMTDTGCDKAKAELEEFLHDELCREDATLA